MIVEVGDSVDVKQNQIAIFVLEFCNHFNGTKAARQAGYKHDSAHDTAWRLLRNPEVQDAVETELRKRARRLRIEGDDVVLGIRDSIRRAIGKGDEKTAMKGWELLGKYLGIFEKDNRQKSGQSEEAIRNRLRDRGIDVDSFDPPPRPEPSAN